MAIIYETKTREDMQLKNIEHQIKNNEFKSKEELIQHLVQIKNTGVMLDSKKMQEILSLYDSMHHEGITPLDMTQYEGVTTEKDNLIISKNDERILNNQEGMSQYTAEFISTQNKIIANSSDGQANSKEVFDYMANHQKKELVLVSIDEAILMDNISTTILNKIRFFVINSQTNPKSFKINIETGLFYNVETNEVYEVRKNISTNQYEIYKGTTKVYGTNEQKMQNNDLKSTLQHDIFEEKISYESSLLEQKVKTKKLEKPMSNNMQNAAFTRVGFLIINILTFTILTAMIILLNK